MEYARLCVISILVSIILIAPNPLLPDASSFGEGSEPGLRLGLFAVPPAVPADGDSYEIVYVSLTDPENNPTTIGNDLEVRLSSTNTAVGSVDSVAFIEAGRYYTVTRFYTTETAGTVTISAIASGFASAETTVTTVKSTDGSPAKLNVIALPSPVLPKEGAKGIVIVQLLNSFGSPVVAAAEDVEVSLVSSNEDVVRLDPSITIPRDRFYATTNFITTSSGVGESTIVASAGGLMTGTAVVSTGTTTASRVKVYPLPSTISAAGSEGGWAVVQLEDAKGMPVRSSEDVDVWLLSSDDRIVLARDSTVSIRKGESMAVVKIEAAGKVGTASITPLATGLLPVPSQISALMPSFNVEEKRLAVFAAPPNPAPVANAEIMVAVQLQDGSNAPAPAERPFTVQLSSSNREVGMVEDVLVITAGDSFGITNLKLAGLPGSTTITATAPNFQTRQLQLSTAGGDRGMVIDLVPTSDSIPSHGTPYPAFLAILKSDGMPLEAPEDITVFISSSPPQLATVPSFVKIPRGSSFAVIDITPTGLPGSLVLTSTAEGSQQSSRPISLSKFGPSSIAVFAVFPILLPTLGEGEDLVVVQLRNGGEQPAKNPVSDTKINLSFYPESGGTVQESLIIPRGENFAKARVSLNAVMGDGSVAAVAEGYKLATTKFRTIASPLELELTIEPAVINIDEMATLTARATSEGKPVPDVRVEWGYEEDVAVLTDISESTDAAGEARATYMPRQEVPQRITVSASKVGYATQESSIMLALDTEARLQPFSLDPLFVLLASAIAAEGLVIYLFTKGRRKSALNE